MIRLQVRRNNTHPSLELLQRNAGNDASALDSATAGDAVVAVQRP
jgi:hypothetical protein